MKEKVKIYGKGGVFLLLLLWLGFLLAQKIDLATADLGRHLKNGEWVVENHFDLARAASPLHENFYSYTYPTFPVINHHWGAGVVFYEIYKLIGFEGLSLFYILLSLVVFSILFFVAKRESNFATAVVFSVFLMPLMAERREIRPEIFSYLMAALFLWVLGRWSKKEISEKGLFLLPLLMVFWVNLHVYFFLGIFLVGTFWLSEIIRLVFFRLTDKEFSDCLEKVKKLSVVLVFSALAALINPFGWQGLLYPLQIFKNYGYTIVENRSVSFVENYGIVNPNFFLIKVVLIFLALSFLLLFFANKKKISFSYLALAGFLGGMSWVAIRNFTLLGFFALPILSSNFENIFTPTRKDNSPAKENGIALTYIFLAVVAIYSNFQFVLHQADRRGFGLVPGSEAAAEFLKNEKISGPIFNNYDIGGYLIFNIAGSEKVFVDNRPEAYPDSFFSQVYKPMQERPEMFEKVDQEYNFNAVVFYRHDITPWGQAFLRQIPQNEKWVSVYEDNYAIIYLKNNEANKTIIDKHKIE